MNVKIKKLNPTAIIPQYKKLEDAGMDLYCISTEIEGDCLICKSGIAVEIPSGYVGLLFPRSSISKTGLRLLNSVGVIDAGYRGEITAKFHIYDGRKGTYSTGDRFAQMIIIPFPYIEFIESEELTETERADGGYGSTGV